jgi:hypothetical protein
VYVNEFSVDELGRAVTSTHKHLRQLCGAPSPLDRETVLRCREGKTNDILDTTTVAVVRYLEATQRLKVAGITVEYVINAANVVRDAKWMRHHGHASTQGPP